MATDNRPLGIFNLEGLPPAPRGVPQIEVTFDIDANGIVHVAAKDLGTGKEQKIRIESSSGLSKTDVEKLVREAESHADEDKRKHELIQAKNNLDNLIYSVEKSLKEYGEKVTAAEKEKVEEALKTAKEALKSDQAESIRQETEKLTTASHAIAQKMYEAAAKQKQGSGGAKAGESKTSPEEGSKEHSDVVDADFEVVDGDEGNKK